MKNRFTAGSDKVMRAAESQVAEQTAAVAAAAPKAPSPGGVGDPPKVQTRGASGKLADSIPQTLPIVDQKLLDPQRVRIRAGFERDAAEYKDAEFAELRSSIEEAGGNISPIDVRLLRDVPGFDAELLAGTRRLMACRELKLDVMAVVRDCDDRMADRIHEVENKHRKNKSPYSRGLQYKAMWDSGRYSTLTDLGNAIQTRVPEISDALALVDKAPAGMWAKVSNPGAIKTTQTRPLMAAYDKPAFAQALAEKDSLTVDQLVAVAAASLKPAASPSADGTQTRLAKRGSDYIVKLPSGITEDVAKGAMEAARKYVEARRR